MLLACGQESGDMSMVKSSSMSVESSRLTHHRNASLPGRTLDNAALGSESAFFEHVILTCNNYTDLNFIVV